MSSVIDHLKKVRLEVRYNGRTMPFEFIFGIASDGMCPFEYELLHKTVGDRLHVTLPQAEAPRTFAHLLLPLRKALSLFEVPETYDLAIVILAVTDADPREVVRAMAQATETEGCGGDCGCGCGGH
jgi:hypothetical protein